MMLVMLLACSTTNVVERFEVTREVLLESGRFPTPHALIQTKEGGYVVTGIDANKPWATRTDPEGNVQWRHVVPPAKDGTQSGAYGVGYGVYAGAATMDDDSTLLCGNTDIGWRDKPLIMGMLTRIDKSGQAISHRLFYPQGDERFHLNYLRKCIRWGDGFAVIGQTSRSVGPFFWVLALDAKGDTKWEKLLPGQGTLEVLTLSNHDLILSQPSLNGTKIVRLDATGAIQAQRIIPDGVVVRSTVPDSVIHLISGVGGRTTLRTLNERLEDVGYLAGNAALIHRAPINTNADYMLPNHALFLFGYQREREVHTATIARLSADLNDLQTFSFQPLWVSAWVDDAVSTGKPGEFATVRTVRRLPHWPDEKRVGLVLAFIRVR